MARRVMFSRTCHVQCAKGNFVLENRVDLHTAFISWIFAITERAYRSTFRVDSAADPF